MTVNGSLDYEAASSHDITVLAKSTDGSTSLKNFTISVTDDPDEHDVSAISDTNSSPNQVQENSPLGTPVGIDAVQSMPTTNRVLLSIFLTTTDKDTVLLTKG